MKEQLRSFYRQLPFKRQLYRWLRMVCAPPRWLYQHMYFEGLFEADVYGAHFFMVNHNTSLETEVFWGGGAGYRDGVSLYLWARLCKQTQTILDIGANTGLFSLVAQALNSQSRVHAFEPIDRFAAELERNRRLNGFDIRVWRQAVSNHDGETVIYDLPLKQHYHASLIESEASRHHGGGRLIKRNVQTISLDTFIQKQGLERVDLMKIDVEGYEPEVLEGMGDSLAAMRPTLLLEIQSDERARRIETVLKDLGYVYFDIDERSGLKPVSHLTRSSTRNYLICSPAVAAKLGLVQHGIH